MTVDECIAAYRNVAEQAFTPKRTSIIPSAPTGAFSAKALEAAIKRTVREFCVETECVERRMQGQTAVEPCPHSDIEFRDGTCTKTYVGKRYEQGYENYRNPADMVKSRAGYHEGQRGCAAHPFHNVRHICRVSRLHNLAGSSGDFGGYDLLQVDQSRPRRD